MPRPETRSFTLSPEDIAFIDDQVASGRYANASEVLQTGLFILQSHEAAIERFHDKAAPTHEPVTPIMGRNSEAPIVEEPDAAYSPLRLDYDEYLPALDEYDMTEEQKREFLQSLWTIVVHFVDLGFDPER
jgi:putative addiction module CopG family antidote